MNKYLKYGLWCAGGMALLVFGVVAYVALTLDPNTYKPQIIQAVKESAHRTLKLDGDIRLVFFPNLGVRLDSVSLSEFESAQEFAAIDHVDVSLALWPLLSKRIIVDGVAVSGLKVHVVKFKNGETNFGDLAGGASSEQPEQRPATGAPFKLDIASVKIERAALTFRDETRHADYRVDDLNLETGRITNGVSSPIDFSGHLVTNQPPLDVRLKLKTWLTFDLEKNFYQIKSLNAKAEGVKDRDTFEVNLDVPEFEIEKNQFSGKDVKLNAKLDAALDNVLIALSLPALKGDSEKFNLNGLSIKADIKKPEQAFNLNVDTSVTGTLKTQQFNLPDLAVALNAIGDQLPGKNIRGELKGSLQADLGRKSIQTNLAGRLMQSQIKLKLAVKNFTEPAIRYDVEADRFDADPLITPAPAGTSVAGTQAAELEQPFDLSALRTLNVEGSLRVGEFKAAQLKMNKLRLDLSAKHGILKVTTFSANLYQGGLNSDMVLNVTQPQPQFSVSARLNAIEIGPLLVDALKKDFIEGKGNVGINVVTRGDRVSALKKNLNGTLSIYLSDGAVKGVNLAKIVREIGPRGNTTQGVDQREKTDFSEMKASFKIANGVAYNDDLMLKSPFVRVGGKGEIDVGKDRMNYLVKATIAGTLEGQGGKDRVGGLTIPVRLVGPFAALKYTPDLGSMISDNAKQKVKDALGAGQGNAKTKIGDELNKGLRGLFK
ncbi:AsmA family protein [Ferrigenium sp. UT5]|uniref:AsmA family protein n=1 Tax=Ferrigenium sp. UT5 TaxID=3242105 RepID=UPI00354B8A88